MRLRALRIISLTLVFQVVICFSVLSKKTIFTFNNSDIYSIFGEYDADDFQDYIGSEYWETWIAVDMLHLLLCLIQRVLHPDYS